MSQRSLFLQKLFIAGLALILNPMVYTAGWAQANTPPGSIREFIHGLVGEWVGSYEESTDGEKADNRYFRAVIRQSGPDSYEAVFNYYKPDPQTGALMKIGCSTVNTKLSPDGTATNTITGDGQVRVESGRLKPERHQLCEVLCLSPAGAVQGRGNGRIQVSGIPMGLGKNGRMVDYCSTWSKSNGLLKMSRQFKARFKVLGISKSYDIKAEFTARPGSNLNEVMKIAESSLGNKVVSPLPSK